MSIATSKFLHVCAFYMQWPEYEWQELNVHALATNQLESQVQQAWSSQVSMVYRGGGAKNGGDK